MPPFPLQRPRRVAWPGSRSRTATAATAAVATVLLAGSMTTAMLASAASAATAAASAAALSVNWYESAPYYSTLDSSAPDVGQVMAATGQKAFDMAFILSGGGSCSPSWDGTDPVSSDTQVGSVINEVRANGGDVIVSIGGYNGTKLGQVCGSASATAAAYQQVITKYGLHAFDFDLEEPEIARKIEYIREGKPYVGYANGVDYQTALGLSPGELSNIENTDLIVHPKLTVALAANKVVPVCSPEDIIQIKGAFDG